MIAAWRFFPVEVARLQRLSPSFLRVTFTGDDLFLFADNGYDQRIKLIVPLPDSGVSHLPTGPDWHSHWRELPDERRNPVRTYTVRAVRQELSEVDVDMVLHPGGCGPAGEWAMSARVGDKPALLGPDARHPGPHGGIDFHLPASSPRLLLAGDETAVPAIASIVERLPDDVTGDVILEVPHPDDFLPMATLPGLRMLWRARGDAAHGSALVPAVRAATAESWSSRQAGEPVSDIDVDSQILWEVPEEPAGCPDVYAWLAGEAAVIKTLRRHLVTDLGVDRRCVAFMGYWRLGRAEDNS